jgi:hypothetical protein
MIYRVKFNNQTVLCEGNDSIEYLTVSTHQLGLIEENHLGPGWKTVLNDILQKNQTKYFPG